MQSGQMPQFTNWLQQQAPVTGIPPVQPMTPTGMPKDQEVQMLEGQAKMLEQQLEQIKKRLEEIGK
jgi:hypothetical protein